LKPFSPFSCSIGSIQSASASTFFKTTFPDLPPNNALQLAGRHLAGAGSLLRDHHLLSLAGAAGSMIKRAAIAARSFAALLRG